MNPRIRANVAHLILSCLAIASASTLMAETTPSSTAANAAATPDSTWVVYTQDVNWIPKPLPFAPDSQLQKSPIAAILTQYRPRLLSYQFPVPDGTYKVRLHFLVADPGVKLTNGVLVAAVNGVGITNDIAIWVPGQKDTNIPVNVAAMFKEVEVAARNGKIIISRVPVVYGLEILGPACNIHVRCGSADPFVAADGTRWETDRSHAHVFPITGEVNIGKLGDAKGTWSNISDAIFSKLDELGMQPIEPGLSVNCDNAGNTVFSFAHTGLWRYDWKTGLLKRVDQGHYDVLPLGAVACNPAGAGIYAVGWWARSKENFGVRSLDGVTFESTASFPEKQGTDWLSVDWNANPHTIFAKVHHTYGMTAISTNGGLTYKKLSDDGEKLTSILNLGDGVLLKCFRTGATGTVMRSTDLGENWNQAAQILFANPGGWPPGLFFSRAGKSVYLYKVAGSELFVSADCGLTWRAIPKAPAFCQPLVRGDSDRHLFGFTPTAAYESTDAGETWQAIVQSVPGEYAWWAYDQNTCVFYFIDRKGNIFCFRR